MLIIHYSQVTAEQRDLTVHQNRISVNILVSSNIAAIIVDITIVSRYCANDDTLLTGTRNLRVSRAVA